MRRALLILGCSIALTSGGSTAFADTIDQACGTNACFDNTFTLNYSQTTAQKGTDNYTVTLTIKGTDSGFLMAVSPNISGWSNATLTSAPGGTSEWSAVMAGGLNSGGCDGHGTPFFCDKALAQSSFNDEVGRSAPLAFVWTITDSALPTGTNQVSIKALFGDSENLGMISANLTLQPLTTPSATPEPSSLLLLGSGLVGVAVFLRRRIGP